MKLKIISKILLTLLAIALFVNIGMANQDTHVEINGYHEGMSGMATQRTDHQNGEYTMTLKNSHENAEVEWADIPISKDEFNEIQIGETYHCEHFHYFNEDYYKVFKV